MASRETYKRNQVEWALWQLFAGGRFGKAPPSKVFRTRIKRLLDLDRETEEYDESDWDHYRYAFLETPPEGQGVDASFTAFDVFCLAIALDLLDSGYKQSEILFLLRHIRQDLEKEQARIQKHPPVLFHRIHAKDRPKSPTYEARGELWADDRVFMLLSKVEMKEVYPDTVKGRGKKRPFIFAPIFCDGIESLKKALHKMNVQRRKMLVMELAEMTVKLDEELKQAPLVKRGRK